MTSQLLKSWADSLKILYPKNLKLFLLVTLNSVWQATKVLFKNFWWLVALEVVMTVVRLVAPLEHHTFIISWLILIKIVLMFFVYLSLRPSREKKDKTYFFSYFNYLFNIGLLFFILLIPLFIGGLFVPDLFFKVMASPFIAKMFAYINIFLSGCWMFFILFFLDSDGTVNNTFRSLGRGVKMFIYNVPFCLILILISFVFQLIFNFIIFSINDALGYFVTNPQILVVIASLLMSLKSLFGFIVLLALFTNFYVKRVHDQFNLYFKKV